MTLQHDANTTQDYAARVGNVVRATRQREGLGTILAVVVISTLIIVGLSYVMEPPSPTGIEPSTPPATYRAQ